jgi:Ca-activated chloride channel family protein
MKSRLGIFAVLFFAAAASVLADGFIVIQEPVPMPGPFPGPAPLPPPRWPRPFPPPRPYAFAPLEVTYHHVQAKINGQIATTSVDQEFYNPNDRQLEGTYIFPIPKGAQINKFSMEIGGKQVEAELMSADKARHIYEDIVRKLKDPALLEYAGRDIFKVRIFPIEPRSKKRIKVAYTQVLTADAGLVSYMYPLNTEKFSAKPIPSVSLKLELETKQPLKSIYSPSHSVEVQRHGDNRATVGFESKDVKPDTDFQLYYSLEGGDLGVNVMAYKPGSEDGYFLLLAAPAFDLKNQKAVFKDVAFVLDTSGSMAGSKLNQAKKALQFCVENLNEGDRFEIMRFSTETEPLFSKLVEANDSNRARARDFIKDLKPIGGTAIDEALLKSLEIRPAYSNRPYIVIFLTDGMPTVGNTDEDQIVAHVVSHRQTSEAGGATRVFCFGIGHDVNTHLLDKITEATRSFSQYVLPEEDIEVKVSNFFTKIKEPLLTNLKLSLPEGVRATKLYPSPLPDLFKGEQLVIAGRYSRSAEGKVMIEGKVNGESKHFAFNTQFSEEASEYEFIPRLWATRRVGYLLDEIRLHGENTELREEVTELARRYGVVTPYTSYLIVEDEARHNVPVTLRTMDSYSYEPAMRQQAGDAWLGFQEQKDGSQATASARYGRALKSATTASGAISQGNFELQRAQIMSQPAPAAPQAALRGTAGAAALAGRRAPSGPATAVTAPAGQAIQQSQFVGGRTFYQNGNQWIEGAVQKMAAAQRIRIQFNSAEYFALAAKEPKVLRWLALGSNVQFVLGDKVYEISDDESPARRE